MIASKARSVPSKMHAMIASAIFFACAGAADAQTQPAPTPTPTPGAQAQPAPAKPAQAARKPGRVSTTVMPVAPAAGAAGAAAATTAPAAPAVAAAPVEEARPPRPPLPKAEFPNFWDPKSRPHKPASDVGTIRFLTSGDFPPFGFLDSGGRLTGYHVDLARALCTELAATCTIQMRPFDELLTALGDKRGDAVIAGVKVTAETRSRVDWSDAYLTTPGRFVMRDGATLDPTPEGLSERWISVVSGSAHERFVLENFRRSRVVAYPDETAARDALREGVVDAHFGDAVALAFWLDGETSRRCCAFHGGPWLESAYFGEGLRIAVPKGNRRLKRAFDYALQRLAEDGKLAEIYLRWFPRSYY